MSAEVTPAIAETIVSRSSVGPVALVGIAGGVGVGKSTWAAELASALDDAGSRAAVVSSDSFLHPNAELERRGLTLEKGAPATFDVPAIETFLRSARDGRLPQRIPVHSHITYDIDGEQEVPAAGVVILDGVNVLQPEIRHHLDLGLYLDASVDDNRRWFLERFAHLRELARSDSRSFYAQFAALTDDQSAAVAEWTWEHINLPNLRRHIEPTRAAADLVVVAGPDHSLSFERDVERDVERDGVSRGSGS